MFKAKSGRTDSHTFTAAASVADTSGSPRSARTEQMTGLDEKAGAALRTTVETATPDTLISECIFCRYRKPAKRTGESANA